MAPLSQEVQSLSVCYPPHIGKLLLQYMMS